MLYEVITQRLHPQVPHRHHAGAADAQGLQTPEKGARLRRGRRGPADRGEGLYDRQPWEKQLQSDQKRDQTGVV